MISHNFIANHHQGFTLIEIIVSLLVISVALGAVIATTGNSVKHGSHIKEKTIALWVAQNAIAEISIKNKWPSSDIKSHKSIMAGKHWFIKSDIKQTPDKNIRRMDLSVYSDEKTEDKVLSLTTYILKPPGF